MSNEIWRDVVGYEGLYKVSNMGRLWSVKKQKYLYGSVHKENGYVYVHIIKKDGTDKKERLHRLVAKAFLPNPDNLPQVNHKDECKTNNCADNLEWCDAEYNNNYGTRNERIIRTRKLNVAS